MTLQTLFQFDGKTFSPELDGVRLNRQLQSVFNLMKDGNWRTLAEISARTNQPEASISARLRDFRKDRFGSWNVERRHVLKGLWQYRIVP